MTRLLSAYIDSTRSSKTSAMAERLTFWVAVSSPSSWSSSLGSSRNALICSTWANRSLTVVTMPSTSSTTSGFSDRSW